MSHNLLAAAGMATLCLASAATAQDTINMCVRTGIGTAFTSLAGAYNASHENQVALTEVPFSDLVQKSATAAAGGEASDAPHLRGDRSARRPGRPGARPQTSSSSSWTRRHAAGPRFSA